MTWQGWLLIVVAVVLITGGYRYSLSRNKTRDCHHCNGGGKQRGWVWWYAKGECRGKTRLPPRAQCNGGKVPRYGRRVLKLDKD